MNIEDGWDDRVVVGSSEYERSFQFSFVTSASCTYLT